MKRIEWHIVDSEGETVWWDETRQQARDNLKSFNRDIFDEWSKGIKYPLKIVRKEWQLVNEKVVR